MIDSTQDRATRKGFWLLGEERARAGKYLLPGPARQLTLASVDRQPAACDASGAQLPGTGLSAALPALLGGNALGRNALRFIVAFFN